MIVVTIIATFPKSMFNKLMNVINLKIRITDVDVSILFDVYI
jgi:hypothetical protein